MAVIRETMPVWRPRTEIGRKIKHFILTGEKTPPPRQGKRLKGIYGQKINWKAAALAAIVAILVYGWASER